MIQKDGRNLYFNPGCALNLYRPESAEKFRDRQCLRRM